MAALGESPGGSLRLGFGSLRVRCSELNLAIEYEMEALALFRQLRDEVTPQRPFRVGLRRPPASPARDGTIVCSQQSVQSGEATCRFRLGELHYSAGEARSRQRLQIPSHPTASHRIRIRIASPRIASPRAIISGNGCAAVVRRSQRAIGDLAQPGFAATRCGKRSRHSSCACSSGAACVIRYSEDRLTLAGLLA